MPSPFNLLRGNNPAIALKEVTDTYIRKNFENLKKYFETQNQLLDFKFFEVTFTKAANRYELKHGLGYIPQDVLLCKSVGGATVIFHNGLFTSNSIFITVDKACILRFYVGTYWNLQSQATPKKSDVMVFPAPLTQVSDDGDEAVISSGNTLASLGDVDFSTPPTDGQLIRYDEATSKWVPYSSVTKWQKKTLNSNVTADTADIADLKFENLVVGKTYRLSGQARISRNATTGNTDNSGNLSAIHDSNTILFFEVQGFLETTIERVRSSFGGSTIFQATATSITFQFLEATTATLFAANTFMILEELIDYEETTDF